jgi:hypothetical protein
MVDSQALPIAISNVLSSSGKPTALSSLVKRRYEPSMGEGFDSENLDPSLLNSPSKKSKTSDGTPAKKSAFILTNASKSTSNSTFSTPLSPLRTSLGLKAPASSPRIKSSRGSPKSKRFGILKNSRRASSSPFTRIDPPSFSRSLGSSGVPFSLDAALSGSISSYTPKSAPSVDLHSTSRATPSSTLSTSTPVFSKGNGPTLEEQMPSNWFFDIHEDTPEEEATNLMEHSACVLDISSDDDSTSKLAAQMRQKGKENVPPPDFVASLAASSASVPQDPVENVVGAKFRREKLAPGPDSMVEDVVRSPLGEIDAKEFYPKGVDENDIVHIVDEDEIPDTENAPSKADFDDKFAPAPKPVEDDAETVIQDFEHSPDFATTREELAIVEEEEEQEFAPVQVWDDDKAASCADAPVVEQTVTEETAVVETSADL